MEITPLLSNCGVCPSDIPVAYALGLITSRKVPRSATPVSVLSHIDCQGAGGRGRIPPDLGSSLMSVSGLSLPLAFGINTRLIGGLVSGLFGPARGVAANLAAGPAADRRARRRLR